MTSKLIRISIVLLLFASVFVSGAAARKHFAEAQAQTPPQPAATGELSRTITVIGEGTVQLEPDVARATIGVEVTGADVKSTTDEASRTMQDVMDALTEAGIADKDMQTSSYSINVDRSMPSAPEAAEETQYRVRNTVQVTIRDMDSVGDVLDAAIEAGANSLSGVNFAVDDPDRAMAAARRQAVADARARAEELAALHGVAVGGVVSISEVIGAGYPLPVPGLGRRWATAGPAPSRGANWR